MTVVTVDNTNLADMITELGGDAPEPEQAKTKAEPEAKTEASAEQADKVDAEHDDADDVEGDDGVTARQKRELSAKMLKAIGKKHRQVKEAEEFAAHQYREKQAAEARAADLERQLSATQAAQEKPAAEEVEPQRENFATETQYIDAKIKWGVDQGIKERESKMRAEARQADVQAQFKRAAELVPDFEDATNKMPPLTGDVVAYMQESDMFAELGYHFAKNPKDAERLVSLSPRKQLVELGRIEAKLQPFGSSESSPKADDKSDNGKADKAAPSAVDTGFSPSKARSDAPVIKPLTSSDSTQVEPGLREMNTRQMIERFQRDQKVNLHARKRH